MEHFFDKTSKKCLELAKNMFYKWKEKEIKSNTRRQQSQHRQQDERVNGDGMRLSSSSSVTGVDASDAHAGADRRDDDDSLSCNRPAGKRMSSRRQAAAVDAKDDDDGATAAGATAAATAAMMRRKRRAVEIQTPAYERQIRARSRAIPYRRRPVRRLEFGPTQQQSSFLKAPAVEGATSSPIYYGSPRQFQVRTTSIRALRPADADSSRVLTISTKNNNHQQRQIIIPQRRLRQHEADRKEVAVDRCRARKGGFECFDEFSSSDDGAERRAKRSTATSVVVADSPILIDTVKVVVQQPVRRTDANSFKRREMSRRVNRNPCVVREVDDVVCISSSSSGDGTKKPPKCSTSVTVDDDRKQSRRFASGTSNSSAVLEDECCENLINERLELRSARVSNSNLRTSSEWDDDEDESAEGAVGGPLISASIRV